MFTTTNVRKKSNLMLAYNRLVTNPESTYKNYFRNTYNDFALSLNENIERISAKMKSGYCAEKTIRTYMPKANGLSRMYTLLSIEDQIVYQAYANIIAEAISNKSVRSRYKKSVFGNLFTDKNCLFFYQPWQKSYISYTRAIINAYKSGLQYIASFDLTACYDSINHSLIKGALMKNHFSENCAIEFINLLSKWESATGPELGTGIPQGPQASGIVSEMILSEYDAYIEKLQKHYKFKYFRYVDDIRILSDNEETVRWILFLLDKKSKELGLFPQSSKIVVHKIEDITVEIKRISLPLFDDDFDDEKKPEEAVKNISRLLRQKTTDLTQIKRYFHFVKHSSNANKLSIKAVTLYPNLIHSFAYYVLRYPRKLPSSITNYIYDVCNDKTQQFASGILLESSIEKFTQKDKVRFSSLAKSLLREDRRNSFIVDCRFRVQLVLLLIRYAKLTEKQTTTLLNMPFNWWEDKELLFGLANIKTPCVTNAIIRHLSHKITDVSLAAVRPVIEDVSRFKLPLISEMSPATQNTLKRAGIIQRSRYSNSQINKYLSIVTEKEVKILWKKLLGKEHDPLERNVFSAMSYWKTDLTAFVNIWDTIDDRLCDVLTSNYPQLGGYSLGKVGSIESSSKFKTHLPKLHSMIMEIHKLRLQSHLSHSMVRSTHAYTGPIKQKERKRIQKLIVSGMDELTLFLQLH